MKFTYDFLARGEFQQLWGRIINTPTGQRASYRLGKLHDKLESTRKKMAATFMTDVAAVFGEKNPDGSFVVPQEPKEGFFFENGIMVAEAKRAKYQEALKKLGGTEVALEMDKLPRSFLDDVKIAPREQALLEPFFEDSLVSTPTVTQLQAVADKPTA